MSWARTLTHGNGSETPVLGLTAPGLSPGCLPHDTAGRGLFLLFIHFVPTCKCQHVLEDRRHTQGAAEGVVRYPLCTSQSTVCLHSLPHTRGRGTQASTCFLPSVVTATLRTADFGQDT